MRRQGQCTVCYHYIEFEDGVAYCFTCDEVLEEPEHEEKALNQIKVEDLPF